MPSPPPDAVERSRQRRNQHRQTRPDVQRLPPPPPRRQPHPLQRPPHRPLEHPPRHPQRNTTPKTTVLDHRQPKIVAETTPSAHPRNHPRRRQATRGRPRRLNASQEPAAPGAETPTWDLPRSPPARRRSLDRKSPGARSSRTHSAGMALVREAVLRADTSNAGISARPDTRNTPAEWPAGVCDIPTEA